MAEPKPVEDKISVAIESRAALIRVEGRGSFKVSTSLKEFATTAMAGGAQTAVVDMTDCIGMDSTFMGVLAGVAGRLKGRGGRMALVNLSPKTRALIATLGLDQIVAAFDEGQTPEEYRPFFGAQPMRQLAPQSESKRMTAATMLEAHETLSNLTPENAPRFKDVLEFLREDLRKKSEERGSSA